MTIRFNVLAGCESGSVKGIDTVNHGIYVVHKPVETYADVVNYLEWAVKDDQSDFMQVENERTIEAKLKIIEQFLLINKLFLGIHCDQTESHLSFKFC
jgi:hypothetical protein